MNKMPGKQQEKGGDHVSALKGFGKDPTFLKDLQRFLLAAAVAVLGPEILLPWAAQSR